MKILLPILGSNTRVFLTVNVFLLLLSNFHASPIYSQTRAMQFTEIPFSDPEVRQYNRGAEDWNYMAYIVDIPAQGATTPAKNLYYRYKWWKLEPSQGNYNFSEVARDIRYCMDRRMKLSFGIMHLYIGDPEASVQAGGTYMSYPLYLHNMMQAEAPNSRDYISGGWWIPNVNSPNYLTRMDSLNSALNRWLDNNYYQPSWSPTPIRYKDAIWYVDMRGQGNWGEWNTVGYHDSYNDYPAGRQPTYQSLKRIIQSHTTYYPDIWCVALTGAFDSHLLGNVWNPPAIAGYLADTAGNRKGRVGWRRDDWGDPWNWHEEWTFNNNRHRIRDTAVGYFIGNMWKYAPVVGEPASDAWYNGGYSYFPDQVRRWHITSFGQGNYYGGNLGGSMADYFREASKLAGYRVVLTGGSMPASIAPGGNFSVTLNWLNTGVAPVYDDWVPVYQLVNANGQVVQSWNTNFRLKLFQPSTAATAHTQSFQLPANTPAGTYSLRLLVRDPVNYMEPFSLNIRGRAADGSYLLANNITVGGVAAPPPPNVTPTANAGADQAITLPTNTVVLNGSGTDTDGTIATYAWTKVSGPAGGAIQTPDAATTSITGLNAGTYVFRLTVTDNDGATDTDDVQVVVNNAPPAPNVAPTANAGADRNITLPTNTVTLNGSGTDTDGTIASYAWTKVSGPAGGNIQAAAAATTSITGLNAGTYVFRLTVTDNDGGTDTDDVQVVVNNSTAPSPSNQAPAANAGANLVITLPINTVTLNGSGTDADGSIATYAWTKVSGPAGGNIQSPATAATQITAMTAGTYVFRLTVADNSGAEDTDDVQVLVNSAPVAAGNTPPIANAGANLAITLPASTVVLAGSGTDADGTIASYGWTKVSGPAGGAIGTPNQANTSITGLTAGTYVFRLTVTDNIGASSTDDVQVVVNAAPVPVNQAPIANAGADLSITLPVNSVTLNGSGSRDPDGSIATYSWRKVSGPNGGTLSSTSIRNPVANDMVRGTYEYELTVTDNVGARSSDRVRVTVIRINKKPVINAVDTVSLSLPVQNTELSAADSYDPDGTITNYQWTYVSGPQAPKVLTPGSSRTVVTDLVEGTYRFRVEATDNDNEKSSKAVVVIVQPNTGRRIVPDVNIYPNPAVSVVNIAVSSELNGRTTLTFYDMNGRPVMTDVFTKASRKAVRQVNIARLPKGTYGILIQVDQAEKVVEKLVKH